jgi:hypothetical protein
MTALGWELPLDAICVNGSFAQIVTFAKLRERPEAEVRCVAALLPAYEQSGR